MNRKTAALTAIFIALSGPAAAQALLGWAMLPALEGLDADGDGAFSQAEIGGTRLPAEWDVNDDGVWSAPEITQALFARWDGDESGLLEQTELATMTGLAAAGIYTMDTLD